MTQLKCENLTIGYDGKEVLKNLSFQVNSGDYLCIVGENGSGKSTLIKTILGLQKLISGNIKINVLDENTKKSTSKIGIGYLPQQTQVQKDFPASVKEIVLSGFQAKCGLRPFYNKSEKQLAEKNMEKLGVLDLKKRCYCELSGGQQQRVLLARAICASEKMLLLDEPVASLDPKATTKMYKIIDELNKKDAVTIIMISHDLSSSIKYATHVLHLGKNIFYGTKQDYLKTKIGQNFANSEGGDEI